MDPGVDLGGLGCLRDLLARQHLHRKPGLYRLCWLYSCGCSGFWIHAPLLYKWLPTFSVFERIWGRPHQWRPRFRPLWHWRHQRRRPCRDRCGIHPPLMRLTRVTATCAAMRWIAFSNACGDCLCPRGPHLLGLPPRWPHRPWVAYCVLGVHLDPCDAIWMGDSFGGSSCRW